METYAQVLNYAIPFFVLLIAIEAVAAHRMGMKINRGADMISSLSSGISNTVKDVLGLTVVIISYPWMVELLAVTEIKATWLVYLLGFIGLDFAGYWMHRLQHEVNFFWNHHIIHHSSEEFNLSCALRQSISVIFSFFNIFLIPAAIMGIPGEVIAVIAPLHLFAQFWYHTRLIDKMGWLEFFLVTPSHHRVHHAMNAEYLDKNYGQIFIFWDKWFGTFQPELKETPPVYGVKRPVRTWNPIVINFQHLALLIKDAWGTRSWWDKLRIWFMPTGWRPADVAERYPVYAVKDVSHFDKYDTKLSRPLLAWSWFQLVGTLLLMFYLFNRFSEIGVPGVLLYGFFLFASVFSYTTLMDKSRLAIPSEVLRLLYGLTLLWWQGGWFGLDAMLPGGSYIIALYFLMSLGLTWHFYQRESREAPELRVSREAEKV